jgi:hypothetical protein
MNKKLKQITLLILLAVVLITMVLQFKYFGTDQYWLTVLVLVIAWLINKKLQNHNT